MSRHPATTVYVALTGLFALGAFFQPFTFGLGYFGSVDGYGLHEAIGAGLLQGLTVLILIAALVSPDRARLWPWALGLLLLVGAQTSLTGARDDASVLAALHPPLGVSALLMAGWMHWLARRPAHPAPSPPATTGT